MILNESSRIQGMYFEDIINLNTSLTITSNIKSTNAPWEHLFFSALSTKRWHEVTVWGSMWNSSRSTQRWRSELNPTRGSRDTRSKRKNEKQRFAHKSGRESTPWRREVRHNFAADGPILHPSTQFCSSHQFASGGPNSFYFDPCNDEQSTKGWKTLMWLPRAHDIIWWHRNLIQYS